MEKLLLSLFLLVFILTGCSNSVYQASTTYTIPASIESSGPLTYQTMENGTYIIGLSPSEYASGLEKEFVAFPNQSYVAGVDFAVGTYDLIALNGGGLVKTNIDDGLFVELVSDKNISPSTYDNYTFQKDEVLNVDNVELKLEPQNNDTTIIPPSIYDVTAISGNGYILTYEGEILNIDDKPAIDNSVPFTSVKDFQLNNREKLETHGLSVSLKTDKLKSKTTEARQVTEQYIYDPRAMLKEVCSTDISGSFEQVNCEELVKYDTLILGR